MFLCNLNTVSLWPHIYAFGTYSGVCWGQVVLVLSTLLFCGDTQLYVLQYRLAAAYPEIETLPGND